MNSSELESPCVAIIDVGSNSIKLLVARRGTKEPVESLCYQAEEVRIGEGITGSPPIIEKIAIQMGAEAILRLCRIAKTYSPVATKAVATSAAREADNKEDLITRVREIAEIDLEILSGEQEADLIGHGIQCDPKMSSIRDYTLIDLGGGSLELVQFSNGHSVSAQSLALGCVRLASKFVVDRSAPLDQGEQAKIARYVNQALEESGQEIEFELAETLVLTGGTANIISRLLKTREPDEQTLAGLHQEICEADLPRRIQSLNIPEARADVFPTASTIIKTSLDFLQSQRLFISKYNLRYGLAKTLLDEYS